MQKNLNSKLLRDGFMALVVLGIMLNMALSLNAYSQNKISDLKEKRLAQSWDMQFRLEQIKSLILNPQLTNQNVRVLQSIHALDQSRLEASNVFILKELEKVVVQKDHFQSLRLIDELYNSELRHLRAAIDQNNIQDLKAGSALTYTLVTHLMILCLFATGLMFYRRTQMKNQARVTESLNNLKEMISILDEMNMDRHFSTQSPIRPVLGSTEFIENETEIRSKTTSFNLPHNPR